MGEAFEGLPRSLLNFACLALGISFEKKTVARADKIIAMDAIAIVVGEVRPDTHKKLPAGRPVACNPLVAASLL